MLSVTDLPGCTVTQYPYRTARVYGEGIPYGVDEEYADLERALAQIAMTVEGRPASVDNHVVYEVVRGDGSKVCVEFSNSEVTFGTQLEARLW